MTRPIQHQLSKDVETSVNTKAWRGTTRDVWEVWRNTWGPANFVFELGTWRVVLGQLRR